MPLAPLWARPKPVRGPRFQTLLKALVALSMLGLAGCDLLKTPAPGLSDARNLAAPAPAIPPSAASQALSAYYAQVQLGLLEQGLLRTDGGTRDAPFTDRILAENFIKIAAFDEYTATANGPVQLESPSTIRRWQTPVRIGLRFGASVSADMRAADTARVGALVAQLARATRHPIRMDNTNPNFIVQIVNEDERQALGPTIAAAIPGLTGPELAGITNMPRSTYCLVYAQSGKDSSTYTRAFAVIRAEHPDLLRLSCLHEEIAQGLGLANDSPRARPSIFNDNEEFALLTPQDELMLRMLYDPRLTPGMTADEARPIAATLATQFMGGES
jgi:hypothetical protein